MDEDRLDRVERRLSELEEQVRLLAGQRGTGASGQESVRQRGTRAAGQARSVGPAPLPRRPAALLTSEQWIGQRVLLAVGVVALILAAGYLLRLSFDRGWISPLMRCVGGAGAGVMVGALGWRLHARYRTYGAALIGCGAAIIYLSVWAAARLYGVLPPTSGIVGLALVSIALAMIAYAIDQEALGATAALGALFAPLLLGRNYSDADLLLLYLGCMAAGLGLVAARRRWRYAMFVVALSYFGVAYAGAADRGSAWGVLLYGVLGGSAGIHVGLRERWWETRFLSFSGGWIFVAAASSQLGASWGVLGAGLVLAAPVWWYGLRSEDAALPVGSPPSSAVVGHWAFGELLYFLLTPVLLGWAVHQAAPVWFENRPGLVPLLVAVPYLIAGYQRPRHLFALAGAAALGVSVWQHWSGVARVWALLGLVLLWATLDHRYNRRDGRWYALATLWAALQQLFGEALDRRTDSQAAFLGAYALALWGTAGVTLALAAGLWRRAGVGQVLPRGLWALGGAMVLFGVTGEIQRYFHQHALSSHAASLASGLAVSAWWLLFAAALVAAGFRRGLKAVRISGLVVAGLAVVKVLVFDLSTLDALYRVGSVFILGLVFLLLAYLYHRQERSETRPRESAPGL